VAVIDRRKLLMTAMGSGLLAAVATQATAYSTTEVDVAEFQSGDILIGNPRAPVSVYEYLSPSCIHCATWHRETFPRVQTELIDTGQISWVLREVMTPPLNLSFPAVLLARRVGPNQYFSFINAVFAAQPEIFRTGDIETSLVRIAQSFGLGRAEYDACLRNWEAIARASQRTDLATASGIVAAPTFVVGNISIEEGQATTVEMIAAAVAKARRT